MMQLEIGTLVAECRNTLVQYEGLDTLLLSWCEALIGDPWTDELLDDLCLLLNYRVHSWGSRTFYTTYTSWWEVEGYLIPECGLFTCADMFSMRQRILTLSDTELELVLQLAYQAYVLFAGLPTSARRLPDHPLPDMLAIWLRDSTFSFPQRALRKNLPYPHNTSKIKACRPAWEPKSKEQRHAREQELTTQSCQRGYLLLTPDTPPALLGNYRHWCKAGLQPYVSVEMQEPWLGRPC